MYLPCGGVVVVVVGVLVGGSGGVGVAGEGERASILLFQDVWEVTWTAKRHDGYLGRV